MAFSERLATDIREVLIGSPDAAEVSERKMFGGLAFMHRGRMFCGVVNDELMLRLGPDGAAEALKRPEVREMDFTGRPMKGYVFVEHAGADRGLADWVGQTLEFVKTLPPK